MSAHELTVSLGDHSYPVRIGRGELERIGAAIEALGLGRKVAIITDGTVEKTYACPLKAAIEATGRQVFSAVVNPGETAKDTAHFAELLSFLAQSGLGRRDPVVALGGGVVGDLAGFVAASYLRGVPYIQAPTTLLAMVDSSVGGKTGINLPEGKNLVGAFHQPRLVAADLAALDTLPPRELAAGMAEVVKYGIIADAELFRSLRRGPPADLGAVVRRCVEIKAEVVADDEREITGRRAILNFGHTLGHAIENTVGYGKLLHGEAISIGMRAAAHLSRRKAGLPAAAVREIEATLAAQGLPLHAAGLDRAKIAQALKLDKKGANQWVLAPEIGRTVLAGDVTAAEVDGLLDLIATPPAA